MMTTVWEEPMGNDCDPLSEKSTISSDESVKFIEFPIQSSPEGKKVPSDEEEMGGNNSGHSSDKSTTSSDKSTTSSDKSTLTSVSVKSSDTPDSSPPTKRPRLADKPRIDLGSVGRLSMEEHLAYVASLDDDDYEEFQTMPKFDVRAQFREYAELALAHYKKEKGLDYEYVGVRAVLPFRFPSHYRRGTHLNFFARLCGSGSKELCFFYAELNHSENKVYNCCILPEKHDSEAYMIQHPSHVQCEECKSGSRQAFADSTDEESLTSDDEPPIFM